MVNLDFLSQTHPWISFINWGARVEHWNHPRRTFVIVVALCWETCSKINYFRNILGMKGFQEVIRTESRFFHFCSANIREFRPVTSTSTDFNAWWISGQARWTLWAAASNNGCNRSLISCKITGVCRHTEHVSYEQNEWPNEAKWTVK